VAVLRFICVMKKPNKKVSVKKLPNKDLLILGKRIKELRVKKGYTNYEYFAYENDIPRAQYGRYEKGEDLKYSSLVRVVKAMGISMEEFFSEGFD
jgi:transcriptional regulator with XRE-family HTH domain